MKSAVTPPRTSSVSQKSVEATRQARFSLALLEQLAEDRDERAGERGVGDERAHEVRDLDRDRERVDEPGDAEEVGADHLAHEAEHARDGGGGREDGGRAGDPAAVAARRRCGVVGVSSGGSMARCDSPSGVCYHRAARSRGRFFEWRTSSNRRSASASRSASGREPPLPVDDQDADEAARERPSRRVTPSASPPSTASSCGRSTARRRAAPCTGTPAARKKSRAAQLVAGRRLLASYAEPRRVAG